MDVLLLFMLGEKDCFSFRAGTPQLTSSINSIESRHADIKDGDIRMVRFRQAHGILAVRGLSQDLKFLPFQQRLQSLTHQHVVIREYDSNWHDWPPMEVGWKARFLARGGIRFAAFRRLRLPAPASRLAPTPSGKVLQKSGSNRNARRRPGSNTTAQSLRSGPESRHCLPSHA